MLCYELIVNVTVGEYKQGIWIYNDKVIAFFVMLDSTIYLLLKTCILLLVKMKNLRKHYN